MAAEYFFSTGGIDTNNGLSESQPKQTIPALMALMLAGNTLRRKRGDIWARDGSYGNVIFDVVGINPVTVCTVTDYGDHVNPPIFDGLEYDNSATGWTHAGSNRWTKAHVGQVDRVLLGGSALTLGTSGLSWAGVAPTVEDTWWWSGGTLHINNGSSSVAPPVSYGGLAYSGADTSIGVRFRDSSNLIFQNQRVLGAQDGAFFFQAAAADVQDIQLDDCEGTHCQVGFKVRSDAGAFKNKRITLNRPIFNMKTDATENEGSSARWGNSDGYQVSRNFDDVYIYDPTSIRARHSGINCFDEVGDSPGRLTVISRAAYGNFDSTVIEYGRALAVAGSIAGQNVKISGIRSTGQSTRSQFSGTCTISGNSWKDMRWSNLPGYEVSQAVWFSSWDVSPGNSWMVDVTFQNNLIEDPWSVPIYLLKDAAGAGRFDANKVRILNNTIIDVAHYGYLGRKSIFATGSVPVQAIQNNNLITPSAGAQHVSWNGVLATINETAGFSGNVEQEGYVDRLNGDYHPTLAGGLRYAGVLGTSGALDSAGLAFNVLPSIAPTEYVVPPPPIVVAVFTGNLVNVSETHICSRALQHLGSPGITSITEANKRARACLRCYAALRDSELRAHPWNFAIVRVNLPADATAPVHGPARKFPLPADCLRLLPTDPYRNWHMMDWQIEGRAILTNDSAPLPIRYIAQITDPNLMDSLFREALALSMAFNMCEEITQSNTKKDRLRSDRKTILAEAKFTNAIENVSAESPEDSWLAARM